MHAYNTVVPSILFITLWLKQARYGRGYVNPFMFTVPTFAVRETDVSRHNGGISGAPLKPLRDDSALRALSSLRGLRGAPEVPPLCRETSVSRTANVGTVGKNWLRKRNGGQKWVNIPTSRCQIECRLLRVEIRNTSDFIRL